MSNWQPVTGNFDADGNLLQLWGPNGRVAFDPVNYLAGWALAQAFSVTTATRNSDGAITTASIVWPDGVTGTYTADSLSTAFPGATDAWHATYNASGTKTVTQPAVTRDSNGAVTAQPAITIS